MAVPRSAVSPALFGGVRVCASSSNTKSSSSSIRSSRHRPEREAKVRVLHEFALRGDVEGAEAVIPGLLEHTPLDGFTFHLNTVLKACANAGELQRATAWHNRMREHGIRANAKTYGKLVKSAAKGSDFQSASRLLETEVDSQESQVMLCTVIDACARAGLLAEAEKWMLRIWEGRAVPDAVSYAAVINAYARAAQSAGAVAWFDKLTASRLVPHSAAYNSVVHACAASGAVGEAAAYLSRMRDAKLQPTAFTYGALVNGHAKLAQPVEAAARLEDMQVANLRPNDVLYNSVINACARAARPWDAAHWLSQMQKAC